MSTVFGIILKKFRILPEVILRIGKTQIKDLDLFAACMITAFLLVLIETTIKGSLAFEFRLIVMILVTSCLIIAGLAYGRLHSPPVTINARPSSVNLREARREIVKTLIEWSGGKTDLQINLVVYLEVVLRESRNSYEASAISVARQKIIDNGFLTPVQARGVLSTIVETWIP